MTTVAPAAIAKAHPQGRDIVDVTPASGLRYDDRPGKVSLAGAVAGYKGESGLAVGVGYAATDRLRFNASFSGSPSQNNYGGVVGGSFTLN